MYSAIFEKIDFKIEVFWLYEGFDLQAFNDKVTRLWGYVELMIISRKGRIMNEVERIIINEIKIQLCHPILPYHKNDIQT